MSVPPSLVKPLLGYNRSGVQAVETQTLTQITLEEGSTSCAITGAGSDEAVALLTTKLETFTCLKQVAVKARLLPALAGVDGTALKQMEAETGATIVFDAVKNKALEKTCYIYASSEAATEAAAAAVQQRLALLKKSAVPMEIKASLIMPLVGNEGKDIKAVETETRCWFVNTRDRSSTQPDKRMCYIYADSPEGVLAMKAWIDARLASLSTIHSRLVLPFKDRTYVTAAMLAAIEAQYPGVKLIKKALAKNTDPQDLEVMMYGTTTMELSEVARAIEAKIATYKSEGLVIECSRVKFPCLVGPRWAKTKPFVELGVGFARVSTPKGEKLRLFGENPEKIQEAYDSLTSAFNALVVARVTVPSRVVELMQAVRAELEESGVTVSQREQAEHGKHQWFVYAAPEGIDAAVQRIKQQIGLFTENTKFVLLPPGVADRFSQDTVEQLRAAFPKARLLFTPYQTKGSDDKYLFITGDEPSLVAEAVRKTEETVSQL